MDKMKFTAYIILPMMLLVSGCDRKINYSKEWSDNKFLMKKTYQKGAYLIECERCDPEFDSNKPKDGSYGYSCTYKNILTGEAGMPFEEIGWDL